MKDYPVISKLNMSDTKFELVVRQFLRIYLENDGTTLEKMHGEDGCFTYDHMRPLWSEFVSVYGHLISEWSGTATFDEAQDTIEGYCFSTIIPAFIDIGVRLNHMAILCRILPGGDEVAAESMRYYNSLTGHAEDAIVKALWPAVQYWGLAWGEWVGLHDYTTRNGFCLPEYADANTIYHALIERGDMHDNILAFLLWPDKGEEVWGRMQGRDDYPRALPSFEAHNMLDRITDETGDWKLWLAIYDALTRQGFDFGDYSEKAAWCRHQLRDGSQ